ncbi:hypothetical protein Q428_08895 [Fervidicella metallireducens AeB]|uniref:HTH cro/C1-type domain-containing protein n=1 Tax=Fervidicella metallireducens AeB TaxID=1403537 RepID=A0A017RU61_9CLOT|nr:helix-turn-helix transcriptional regulator [Fervidicella metallireducens]EYE88308.1 hypothetical protein Q428_08895 [Fervidicella metallireducens AeB]
MSLVERINNAAKNKNMTLASIERELGFGQGTIRKWDKNSPSCDKVLKVANLLQININYLLTGESQEQISYEPKFTDEEIEMINIFRRLNFKQQAIIKGKLYEYEDDLAKEKTPSSSIKQAT